MDFNFDVNQLFPVASASSPSAPNIVRLGSDLLPSGGGAPRTALPWRNLALSQQRAAAAVDAMGVASAQAQALKVNLYYEEHQKCVVAVV